MSDSLKQNNHQSGVPSDFGHSIDNFVCPNCGGRLKWNIRKRQFMCSSCGSPFDIDMDNSKVQEHPLSEYDKREAELAGLDTHVQNSSENQTDNKDDERSVIRCKTCGAVIEFSGNCTATVCPMCGSSQVDSAKQMQGIPPDGVVPFLVDYDDAQEKFKVWIRKRWFAPNALKRAYQLGKLNGMYIPFWTYDVTAEAPYSGLGGVERSYTDSKGNTHVTTDWHPVSGVVSKDFDDFPVCAGDCRRNKEIIKGVLPFNTQGGSYPYSGGFLSGFGSEHYVISAKEAFETAKKGIEEELRQLAEDDIRSRGYDVSRVNSLTAGYSDPGYKQILAPVWVSAFTYRGKQYSYTINGETGQVNGERPYSPVKIGLAAIAAIIVIILFLVWGSDSDAEELACDPGYYAGYYVEYCCGQAEDNINNCDMPASSQMLMQTSEGEM